MICGGIDMGGTKIEARLFTGTGAQTLRTRRVPTPQEGFEPMIAALSDQVDWLCAEAGDRALAVGVAVPGVIDSVTGGVFASNIPAGGRSIGAALERIQGRTFPVVNDCMAFAHSEAHGGAGDGAATVMGLILGTGVGGGITIDGALPPRHAGLAVEIGHVGISARALARHGLPLWRCGCGKEGCMENYVAGTGISRIAGWRLGRPARPEDLAASDDPGAAEVLEIWTDLAGDCLSTIQLMLDPQVIVLGGGLSNLPRVTERLTAALCAQRLGDARPPAIRVARHGDSSGARGAALLAMAA